VNITITDDKGHELHLPIRTQEILRRMIEIMQEVEPLTVGKVIFHLRGKSVIPEISKTHRKSELPG